jgi:hypothetical protein
MTKAYNREDNIDGSDTDDWMLADPLQLLTCGAHSRHDPAGLGLVDGVREDVPNMVMLRWCVVNYAGEIEHPVETERDDRQEAEYAGIGAMCGSLCKMPAS